MLYVRILESILSRRHPVDGVKLLTDVIYPDQSKRSFGYDEDKHLLTAETQHAATSVADRTTRYQYNALNLLESVTRPDNRKITINSADSAVALNAYSVGELQTYGSGHG